jgi:colicin import membrane protein
LHKKIIIGLSLQPHPNNELRKLPSERNKGIVGTAILHVVILVILIIVGFSAPKPPDIDKGLMVNFGTDETGSGLIEPSPPQSQEEAAQAKPNAITQPSKEEALVTQNFDKEAPVVKKVDPEAEKRKKEKIEADRKKREELEAEKIKKAAEDAEKKRVAAEQKRVSDIENRTKNALANSKNTGTNSTSEGITGGQGNQGAPTGSVDSKVRGEGSGTGDKGISYELQGRGFQSLPAPKYDYQGEGRVVVDVSVDRSGKVTQAVPGAKGSTTLDDYLLTTAKEAALKATFAPKPDAPLTQKGTITYNFILK